MASIRREVQVNASAERIWHHNASLQVSADGDGRNRVVYEQGMAVMKRTLER